MTTLCQTGDDFFVRESIQVKEKCDVEEGGLGVFRGLLLCGTWRGD